MPDSFIDHGIASPSPVVALPPIAADLSTLANWQEELRWRDVSVTYWAVFQAGGDAAIEVLPGYCYTPAWQVWRLGHQEYRMADLRTGTESSARNLGDLLLLIEAALKADAAETDGLKSVVANLPAWLREPAIDPDYR